MVSQKEGINQRREKFLKAVVYVGVLWNEHHPLLAVEKSTENWLQRGAVMREMGTLYPVCLAMWVLDMECSCIPNWNKLFFTVIEISLRVLCDSPQSHLSSEF